MANDSCRYVLRICLIEKKTQQIYQLTDEVEAHTNLIQSIWPVTDKHLVEIVVVTQGQNLKYSSIGWPANRKMISSTTTTIEVYI